MTVEQLIKEESGVKLIDIRTGEVFIYLKYDDSFTHQGAMCTYLNGNVVWLNPQYLELNKE